MAPTGKKVDRRRWPRKNPNDCPRLVEARLRSGTEVRVVDISNGGALLEAGSQILPGARVELLLASEDQRWLVKGRIVRCHVSSIMPCECGVRYRAALAFNEPLSILDELLAKASNTASSFDRVQVFALRSQTLLPLVF